MVQGCAVFGCKNYGKNTGASFHRFPECEAFKKKWVVFCRRDKWLPTTSSRICSIHFENACFVTDPAVLASLADTLPIKIRNRLKSDAVPTLMRPNSFGKLVSGKKTRQAFAKRRRIELVQEALLTYPSLSKSLNLRAEKENSWYQGCSKDQKQCAPDMNIIPQEIKLEIIPKIEQGESSSQLASTSSLQTLPDFNDTIRTAVLNIKKEPIDYTEYNQAESSTQLGFSSSSFQTLPAAGPAFLNIKKEPIDYTEYNQEEFSSEPLPSGESSIFKGSEMLPIKIKTEPLDYPDDCNPECILPDFL